MHVLKKEGSSKSIRRQSKHNDATVACLVFFSLKLLIKKLKTTLMSTNLEDEARKALNALDVKRKALESEADAIHAELSSPGPEGQPPMGMDTPLVDQDGYPRADIDVYRARTLRGRFKEIQTDHKAIMKDIEQGLARLAAFKVCSQLILLHLSHFMFHYYSFTQLYIPSNNTRRNHNKVKVTRKKKKLERLRNQSQSLIKRLVNGLSKTGMAVSLESKMETNGHLLLWKL